MIAVESDGMTRPAPQRARIIKALLAERGLTQESIAAAPEPRITRKMVNAVVQGRADTAWVRRLIAEQLGTTYNDLWGEPDPGTERGQRLTPSLDLSNQPTDAEQAP